MSKQWMNGNVGGCMSYLPKCTAFLVRFSDEPSRQFSVKKYGNLSDAEDAARSYRSEMSEKHGLTRNKYRFINGYIEFQLTQKCIGKIDYIDFPKLVYNWHAKKGHNRYYIQTSHSGAAHKYIHNLIYPDWPEVDHINRDGLDNRRCNLRNGKKKNINVKNQAQRKDNSSGKTGVSFKNDSKCWIVQWPENNKRMKKSFSTSKYGMENAKQLAIQFRVEKDKKLGIANGYDSDCEDKDEVYPSIPQEPFTPTLYRTNKSGAHGVHFNGRSWVASWSIDGKSGNKSFLAKTFGDDEAKQMAIKYRMKMCPKLRQ